MTDAAADALFAELLRRRADVYSAARELPAYYGDSDIDLLRSMLDEARAEIAQLRARPEAYRDARQSLREEGYCMACGVYHRVGQCPAVEHARREARTAAIEQAAQIADEFCCGACGMDGKAGAAIRALADAREAAVQCEGMTIAEIDAYWFDRVQEAAAKARAAAIEEAVTFIEGGRFLHDDAPVKRFATEVVAGLRRHFGALAAAA